MRKYSNVCSILSFILSHFIFSQIIHALELQEVIETAPYIVKYGRGIEEEYNSYITYLGCFSLVYSVLIAYIVNSLVKRGSLNQYEKLNIKYTLLFSVIILVPAVILENFVQTEINSQRLYNLFSLIILGIVIAGGWIIYRMYSFSKAMVLGFKLFEMICIHDNYAKKYYFEARTHEKVISLIENNKYIFSAYENAYLDTICLASSIFVLKINQSMKYMNRIIL